MSPKGLAGSASVPTFAQPVGGASLKMNEYTVNDESLRSRHSVKLKVKQYLEEKVSDVECCEDLGPLC